LGDDAKLSTRPAPKSVHLLYGLKGFQESACHPYAVGQAWLEKILLRPQETPHRIHRIGAARLAPVAKLGEVDPAILDLAIMHPGLGLPESLSQGALCQPGFTTHRAEQSGQLSVTAGVLGLGH
jgi:hypothetical protein